MKNNAKLPSWANCWVKNLFTGDIMPAFDNDQTWEIYDDQGKILGKEWSRVRTRAEKIGFLIIFGLAVAGVIFAAALYFGAKS